MGLKFFSRGYFVGPHFLSWLFHGSKIFLVVFCGSKFFFSWVWIFSRGYFVGPHFISWLLRGSKFSRGILWVQIFFLWFWIFSSWVFRGSKFYLMFIWWVQNVSCGIFWVQIFFSWIFCGFGIFPREYFLGPKFFVVSISWGEIFFMCIFRRCFENILVRGTITNKCRPLPPAPING